MSLPVVIIESHIPFVPDGFLRGVADVRFLDPAEITPAAVRDACALLVRTRTRCAAALLAGSAVKLVATATIGTDHIDIPWCRANGIEVVSVPGCNAPAVAQYVWASVMTLRSDTWRRLTLGIVGLGHVGSIVADWGRRLGVKVLACDYPRAETEKGWNPHDPATEGIIPFVSLRQIAAEADVVTFHTPHTVGGEFPTHHMAGADFFDSLQRCPIVINAARGPIVDTEAILSASAARKLSECVIDCWEGEPAISGHLLKSAAIATPHIAGYSIEGKRRATHAVLSALVGSRAAQGFVSAAEADTLRDELPAPPPVVPVGCEITPEAILSSYDPLADTATLREGFTPARFEQLRNSYPLRHEVGF